MPGSALPFPPLQLRLSPREGRFWSVYVQVVSSQPSEGGLLLPHCARGSVPLIHEQSTETHLATDLKLLSPINVHGRELILYFYFQSLFPDSLPDPFSVLVLNSREKEKCYVWDNLQP